MNLRLNIILIIITAGLLGLYFSLQQGNLNLSDLIKREGQPEYVGNKVTTEVFNVNGKPQYFVEADEIKHYEKIGKIELKKPLLNLFNTIDAFKEWQVTAQDAQITKDNILRLEGNVIIKSFQENSKLKEFNSELLFINLDTYDVFTDKVITAKGSGFRTTGKGLKGNLKKQTAVVKENVKTRIELTKLKNRG